MKINVGYKVFDNEMKSIYTNYDYKGLYKMTEPLELHKCGFHYCEKVIYCLVMSKYRFQKEKGLRVFEINILGDVLKGKGVFDYCTNYFELKKEFNIEEILESVQKEKVYDKTFCNIYGTFDYNLFNYLTGLNLKN